MVSGGMRRVGLRAVVEGVGTYVRDARRVNQAQTNIGRSADTAALKTQNFDKQMRALGSRMTETGRQAVFLGTALAGVAAGSAFVAARYESGFVKILNLTGETREALEGMKQAVLDIAVETARAPGELVNTLFVIESGGLRGAEALDALRASAIAAAAGLGDSADISRVATQAVLAYRDSNLSASDAVDILIATAKEGNFETSQLSNVFGRTFGQAAGLGIAISDLGAFIATYTRVSGNAADATTALASVMTFLAGTPTAEGKKALDLINLSIDDLRATARDEGLAQALEQLIGGISASGEDALTTLSAIIPNIRALRGVLATASLQGEGLAQAQLDIADSSGIAARALENLNEDPLFKFQQALIKLQTSMIELGEASAPALAFLTAALTGLADALVALPGPIQNVLVGFTGVSGVLLIGGGTIAIFLGSLLQVVPALKGAAASMAAFRIAAISTNVALSLTVVGLIAAAAALILYRKHANDAADAQRDLAIQTAALKLAQDFSKESTETTVEGLRNHIKALKDQRDALGDLGPVSARDSKAIRDKRAEYDGLTQQIENATTVLEVNTEALEIHEQREREATDAIEAAEVAFDAAQKQVRELTKDLRELSSAELTTALATQILQINMDEFETGAPARAIGDLLAQIRAIRAEEEALADIIKGIEALTDPSPGDGEDTAPGSIGRGPDPFKNLSDQISTALAQARSAAESELNLLGDLVTRALRRAAEAQRDLALRAIDDQRDAQREAHDERLRQIDEEEAAAVRAIEARLEATLGPLRAELEAISGSRDAEKRADIERRLALAFDARERARIEAELREFDRRAREDEIRDQISSAEEAADGQISAAESAFDQRRSLAETENDAIIADLDLQRDAAQAVYAAQTDAWALESEARRLILEGEMDAMTALLEAQVPEWRSAGQSFAQALLDGYRAGGAGNLVGGLSGALGRGAGASGGGATGASPADVAQVQQLQLSGISLKDKGAPSFVLDSYRKQIRDLGGTPAFHEGGIVGGSVAPGREVLVRALPGEGIFTRQQMAALSRPVFEPGAFRGMFEGAHFNGTPQENAAAIEANFERMMERVLSRGAQVSGARSRIG